MTQKSIQANHYVLKGNQTEITYDETTFNGQPQLSYRALPGPATRTFRGDQISSKESAIGTLVTVTLEAVADGDTTLFTLVIPTVNLIDTTEQAFKTIAIITTVQGSIAGPSLIHGAVQSYHVLKLKGKAQFVVS
jgi:hypothetical protein